MDWIAALERRSHRDGIAHGLARRVGRLCVKCDDPGVECRSLVAERTRAGLHTRADLNCAIAAEPRLLVVGLQHRADVAEQTRRRRRLEVARWDDVGDRIVAEDDDTNARRVIPRENGSPCVGPGADAGGGQIDSLEYRCRDVMDEAVALEAHRVRREHLREHRIAHLLQWQADHRVDVPEISVERLVLHRLDSIACFRGGISATPTRHHDNQHQHAGTTTCYRLHDCRDDSATAESPAATMCDGCAASCTTR